MTPETFLEEFGAVANAPGGVQRLREMILQLAVMGKLVKQDPGDEPAGELLQRIKAEKAALIKKEVIKRQMALPDIRQDEMPFKTPEGWEFCRLNELSSVITKGSSPKWQGIAYTDNENDVLFITSENVGVYELILKKKKYVEPRFNEIEPRSILQSGDILMNIVGASIGRVAVYNLNVVANINQAVCLIRLMQDQLYCKYFLYFFNSPICIAYMFGKQVDNARANLSMGNIAKFVIPVPPLEEQKRIVAKVDQLMALCDRLEAQQQERATLVKQARISALGVLADAPGGEALLAAWKRVQGHLPMLFDHPDDVEDLKKCILQNAVMGKLVPQNPDDEPAGELLKKIAEEKAALIKKGEIKKQKPLPEIREDEKPFEIPEGWAWCRLGETSLLITSGSRDWAKYYSEKGAIFLRMGNLSRNSFKLRLNNIQHVSPPNNSEGKRTILRKNDLLISITGDVGMLGLIPAGFGEAYINQHIAVFRPSESLYFLYPPFFCLSPLAQEQFSSPQRGIKNSFRLSDVGELIFPIPPLNEQTRIVQKTQSLLTLCDTLQNQLKKSRTIAEQLAKSIIETITGQTTEKPEKMKAPKTELVSKLKLVKKPGAKTHAPLSAILAKHNDELSAKALWNTSGLAIDDFYRQLKTEMVGGWIAEPEKAHVRIVDEPESVQ